VLAAKYGQFVDDHWSVDELLALVRGLAPSATASTQEPFRGKPDPAGNTQASKEHST
jgi:hypothetical protein